MPGSSDYQDVLLLLKGNGANDWPHIYDDGPLGLTVDTGLDFGSPAAKTSTTQSKFGGSSIFLGSSSSYVRVVQQQARSPEVLTGQFYSQRTFSIGFWVYPTNAGGGNARGIFRFENSRGGTILRLTSTNRLSLVYIRNGVATTLTSTTTGLTNNVWQYVLVRWASDTLEIRVDGTLVATATVTAASSCITFCDSGFNLYLGDDVVNGRLEGYYQDFVIYGRTAVSSSAPTAPIVDYYRVIQGTISESSNATLWQVRAFSADLRTLVGQGVFDTSSSASYTLRVTTAGPCFVVLTPYTHKVLPASGSSTRVHKGMVLAPNDATAIPHLWYVTNSSAAGASFTVPTLTPGSSYGTVGVDGYQIDYLGPLPRPIVEGPLTPIDLA